MGNKQSTSSRDLAALAKDTKCIIFNNLFIIFMSKKNNYIAITNIL